MNKKRFIFIAFLIGLSTLLIPVIGAWMMARAEGRNHAATYLDGIVTDMLRRSAGTRAQIDTAVDALKADRAQAPCSATQMDSMRALAAKASYLTGLGFVQGGRLICSTLAIGEPVALGDPSQRNADGSVSWNGVHLPNVPGEAFNVVARDGYAAIVYPDLVIDILGDESAISLAQIGHGNSQLIRARGEFRPAWLTHARGTVDTFEEGGYLVFVRPGDNGDSSGLAAMPMREVDDYIAAAVRQWVPMGLLLGAILAGAMFFYVRYRLSLKAELKTALNRREFFLVYQPVVDLRTGRCTGAEALIRWNQANGKMVSPVVFIPAAEENGLIRQITAQVMEMVAHDAAELLKNHPDTHIAINFSAEDLQSPDTEVRLQRLLQQAGVSSKNILIEATERGLMAPDKAKGVLISVRSQGFKVAIDDFGTGNSSLSYLATYDLDYLKIDKMFVDALGTDVPTTQVARHIIEIAKSLGLQMIAEGVETEAQRDILAAAGVQYAQGWFFGKPMPMRDLAAFIKTRNDPAFA